MSGEQNATSMSNYFTDEEWESLCTIVGLDRADSPSCPESQVTRDPFAGCGDCRDQCQQDIASERAKHSDGAQGDANLLSIPLDSFDDVEAFKSCGKAFATKPSKSAASSFAEPGSAPDAATAPTTPSNCSEGINGPASDDWHGQTVTLLDGDFNTDFGGADEEDLQAFFTIEEAGDLRKMIHPLEFELQSHMRASGDVVFEYFNERSAAGPKADKALTTGVQKGSISPEISAVSHQDVPAPKSPSAFPQTQKLKRSSTNSSFIDTTPPSPGRSNGSSICEPSQQFVDLSSQRRGRSRKWTEGEDEAVKKLVTKHGAGNWVKVASELRSKTPKQVHARWRDYLRPGITDEPWTDEETRKLAALHSKIGNSWSQLATLLPGRSANAIKNRVNAARRRRRNNPSAGDAEGLWNYLHEDSATAQAPVPMAL